MADDESLPRQLSHTTIRVECKSTSGYSSLGTGFFFAFNESNGTNVPGIVTNKHVLDGASEITFRFTRANAENKPCIGSIETVLLECTVDAWVPHPDPTVDLAVIPIGILLAKAATTGMPLYYRTLGRSLIPSPDVQSRFSALEDVVLIGYPIGLWDSKNNMPIFRKGITATHPSDNFDGRHEFLIDAACFPGSSGSPVFQYKPALGLKGSESIQITGDGPKLALLGVLYAGPQFTVDGKLEVVTVPTQQTVIAQSRIPVNLGLVIKAERILEFETIFEKRLVRQVSAP